ncbi:putative F-box domain-containing protein [Tanacetum coccineum]
MADLIPDDIYENVFLRLDVGNIINCKSVCKSWKSLISESHFIEAHFPWYNIFLRLDVRNLIRCKSVCKLWKSLFSDSHFIKAHLNRSYNSNENGLKRIGEAIFLRRNRYGYSIIGSSYGLVCFTDGHELLVANPLTREVKPVPNPSNHVKPFPNRNEPFKDDDSCWGFGYDSLRDDYKVVCGVQKGKGRTYFKVFSLKSNAWNVIGEVNYTCTNLQHPAGILCNGAIHWVMNPKAQKSKEVILSFDLSKEEFKKVPQPNYARYYKLDNRFRLRRSLGIMEECLCILFYIGNKACVMKEDNAKQSWGMMDNCQIKYETASSCDLWEATYRPYWWDGNMWFIGNRMFRGGPPIVESLISPHL